MNRFFALLLVFLISSVNERAQAMQVTETKEDGQNMIIVENRYFKAVFTSLGGRLKSLINKKQDRNLLSWTPSEGGALDDRGTRTLAVYDYKLISKDENKIVFEYAVKDNPSGITFRKLITVEENLPSIRVDYTLSNHSGKPVEYEHMVRNFFLPAPGKFTDAQCYFYTPRGVQKKPWAFWQTEAAKSDPDVVENKWKITGGKDVYIRGGLVEKWLAIIDQVTDSGIALVFDKTMNYYFWTGENQATTEWICPQAAIKPGEDFKFTVSIVIINDLKGVVGAGQDYLLDMQYTEKIKNFEFVNKFRPISGVFAKRQPVAIRTRLLDTERKVLAELPEKSFTSDLSSLPDDIRFDWKAPQDGVYIIQQELLMAGKKLGGYETPIIAGIGNESFRYRHPDFPLPREMVELRLSKTDFEQGYFLHLPVKKTKTESMEKIDLDLGIGENEYLEIDCCSFIDMGETVLDLKIPPEFSGKAELFIEENYRLLPEQKYLPERGKRNPVWLKLNTTGVNPGEYAFRLDFAPKNSKPAKVQINVKVWPVTLPRLENLYVSAFHSGFSDLIGYYRSVTNKEQMLAIYEKNISAQKDAGINMIEIYPSYGSYMKEYIKVKEFEKGCLPVLDLKEWDPVLEIARRHGMRHAVFRYGVYDGSYMFPGGKEGLKKASEQEKQEAKIFVLKQLFSCLKKHGFERIFYYCIDEMEESKIDDRCRRMQELKKACPDLEFAGSGFAGTSLGGMQKVADYLTWIAPYWSIQNVFQWINTKELKLLSDTLTATQITGDPRANYNDTRISLWRSWKGNLPAYQIYSWQCTAVSSYARNDFQYSCVIPGKDGPVFTPNYAGLVDGNEDFQYLHKVSQLLAYLEGKNEKDKAKQIQDALESIAGKETSLLETKQVSSASFTYPVLIGDNKEMLEARKRILQILAEFGKSPETR